ncbi:serine/threonine-protein kinase ATM [Prunus yedoensis var. nudiflora]|uniref:Serine/threonine-protein kinase ATM n=1 Tax=Prunus yedoensis var. nudiflora TaxID=2094558 RepID=A0A314XQZ6_PRUYE|nr:serine/threonine-protein kinase ATM [Prunus yedoensis var. nudiflora]
MENPRTPETLEAQNPSGKTLEEGSGLLEWSENCTGLESFSDILGGSGERGDVTGNDVGLGTVEVAAQVVEAEKGTLDGIKGEDLELGVDSMSGVLNSCMNGVGPEEVVLVNGESDGDNEAQMGSKQLQPDKENDVQMGSVEPQSDGSLEGLGGDERKKDGDQKMAEDDGMNEDKALGPNGIDTASKKIEVSGEGISLFVDFSGPPPGFNENDLHVTSFPGYESKENLEEFGDDEQENSIDYQDYDFAVGDIVWVKTKTQTWWPGKIYDPVDASKYGASDEQGGCQLVGYFGMSHVAWCHPYQLKPFHEYFEQMSGQNKARIFLGAVEKALEEFGRRVKLNMTCMCVLKENRLSVGGAAFDEGVPMPERKSGELGEFTVTHFNSAEFLAHLKNLAQVVSSVGMLDFTVTRNQLSAFYRSIGHSQLPMHLLQETNYAREVAHYRSMATSNADIQVGHEDTELGEVFLKSTPLTTSQKRSKDKVLHQEMK